MALAPILMNLFFDPTAATFISLILAGVLGWATAYVLVHFSQMILRVRSPELPRPFRSPLFPVPQVVGLVLLALAAYKLFPVPDIKEDAYRYYLYFLAVAVVFSLAYNVVRYKSFGALFRPIPPEEIRRETEQISADLGQPVEPGAPHLRHDRD
jgi:amino acid transporter